MNTLNTNRCFTFTYHYRPQNSHHSTVVTTPIISKCVTSALAKLVSNFEKLETFAITSINAMGKQSLSPLLDIDFSAIWKLGFQCHINELDNVFLKSDKHEVVIVSKKNMLNFRVAD